MIRIPRKSTYINRTVNPRPASAQPLRLIFVHVEEDNASLWTHYSEILTFESLDCIVWVAIPRLMPDGAGLVIGRQDRV